MELKPGGRDIPVTNSNRISYIHLVADYRLNKQVSESKSPQSTPLPQALPCKQWCRSFYYSVFTWRHDRHICCPKPILWELNCFLTQKFSFTLMAAGHLNENALLARQLNTRKADRQIANSWFVSPHYQFCARHTTTQTHCSSHSLSLRSSFKTRWSSYYVYTYNPSCAGLRTMLDALKLATVSPERLNIFTVKSFPVSVSYSHHLITWIVIKGDSLNCVVDPPSLSVIQGRAIRCDQLGVAPDVWSQWITGNLSFLL